jgi:hypothetical protein
VRQRELLSIVFDHLVKSPAATRVLKIYVPSLQYMGLEGLHSQIFSVLFFVDFKAVLGR